LRMARVSLFFSLAITIPDTLLRAPSVNPPGS
jgi:hypothetical protein